MNSIYLIVILIIALLVVIWAFSSQEKRDIFSNEDTLVQRSAGIADKPAMEALNRTRRKKNKTPKDKHRIARILSDNVLGGDTPIVGDNANITKEAAENYNEAVREVDVLAPNFDALIITADNFRRRLGNTIFEIDEDDAFLTMIQPLMMDEFRLIIDGLDQNITQKQEEHANNTIQHIKQQIKQEQKPAAEIVANFANNMQSHTSDPQNSHDSNVNKEINRTLYIIERDQELIGAQETLREITAHIKTSDLPAHKKEQAINAINTISAKNQSMSTYGNKKEIDIIRTVWSRAYHPSNADNKDNIKDAVIDALVDINERNGWGEQTTVCANGRMSRVVGALATLDYDESVGRIQTKEQIKNYVLQQSAKLWDDFLKECANDPDLAHIAAAYNTHTGPDENDPQMDKFKSLLKARADKMLSDNDIDAIYADIKRDVYIGLDI